jgi:hypothetical protein
MTAGIKANADGSGAIQVGGSDAITITSGLNTTFAGTVTSASTVAGATGTLYPLVRGTAVASTSGTSIDFTGIPSWVDRITVMFQGVSISGTSNQLIQIGSGSITSSGYVGGASQSGATSANATQTAGLQLGITGSATFTITGIAILTNITGNAWVMSFYGTRQTDGYGLLGSSSITLSGVLDRVRITTVNGTDTFDAGSINILYE